jgi:hypothetical protein
MGGRPFNETASSPKWYKSARTVLKIYNSFQRAIAGFVSNYQIA